MTRRKRLLLAALLPILALSVAGIAFAVRREVSPGGSARADTPVFGPTPPVGNQTPEWFVAPEQTRSAEPVLSDQVINGIHVGRDVRRQGGRVTAFQTTLRRFKLAHMPMPRPASWVSRPSDLAEFLKFYLLRKSLGTYAAPL